ncbi:hypothetical protein K435DRAFT_881022 [Dendrothele bispora CBS 962.96]|uniref:Uncharacterized protein n=1 Tax=Dendrothele bispora (strain CBS 962.96) TaxID=1314807 RepID=A0A4V4HAF3_DENBC|nr:hypothetical protein K435DRAFT_881022 [Dendrothele bispora CBS 962.96]
MTIIDADAPCPDTVEGSVIIRNKNGNPIGEFYYLLRESSSTKPNNSSKLPHLTKYLNNGSFSPLKTR